jgi:transposase
VHPQLRQLPQADLPPARQAMLLAFLERGQHGQKNSRAQKRALMVAFVRTGQSMRAAARKFRVSLWTVQRWVARAHGQRLDRVDWTGRPPIPHTIHRTPREVEDLVLNARRELKEVSDLGEYGAAVVYQALLDRGTRAVPSIRTIGRIVRRRGALDGHVRLRRPAPPRGWYLPAVVARQAELDSFDIVEALTIQGGIDVEVLTALSLHGGLPAAWPGPPVTAKTVVAALIDHWRTVGLPGYAQFDNDTRFEGAHQFRDSISRVMRVCLSLNVVPVFTPVQEPAFQAGLENFNGRYQVRVWARFRHTDLAGLRDRSDRHIAAYRRRAAARIDAAPRRRPFPTDWSLDLQAPLHGQIIFLRRTTERGCVRLLGRPFDVDSLWTHRLLRCEVNLDAGHIRFYALRRREPDSQPLLREVAYVAPRRRFRE